MTEQTKEVDREEVKAQLEEENEFVLDLENQPKQGHIWTDRGLKMTCENAGHPPHEAWKRRKAVI